MTEILSSESFSWAWRVGLAQALVLFLFVLGLVSFSTGFEGVVRPCFFMICVYYWTIYRPTLLLPAYVFVLGLIYDFILHYPTGLHAALFVFIHWIIRDQRLFFIGQPYVIVLMGFVLSAFSLHMVEWIFFGVALGNFENFSFVWMGTMVSALLFPLVTLCFNVIQRILPATSNPHMLNG